MMAAHRLRHQIEAAAMLVRAGAAKSLISEQ